MKRLLSVILVLVFVFFTGCSSNNSDKPTSTNNMVSDTTLNSQNINYSSLSDPSFLQYVDDCVCRDLETEFCTGDFEIYDISSTYISKEYLEEVEYNSKENIYFGYKLSELNNLFEGQQYIFTLGNDGKTTYKVHEEYDNSFEKEIIKNVAIGTGVILVCVTVSVATAGVGSGAVSVIFAASAKSAAEMALSSSLISGAVAGIVIGYKTKNFDEALKAASLTASKGFKWGAISGALIGGGKELLHQIKPKNLIPSYRTAEMQALEKYGGREQISFLNGEEVSIVTEGATRPDIVRTIDGHLEAIEVKNYDLSIPNNVDSLCNVLKKEISDRIVNLPSDATQRIVLNVQGRDYTKSFINSVIDKIADYLFDIYPDIPIDVMA